MYEYAKIFITANNYGDLNNNLIKLFMCEARKLWLGKINGLWWSTAIPNSWLLIWETVQIRSSHIITLRDSTVNYYGSSGKWLPAYPNVAQGILAVTVIVFVKQKADKMNISNSYRYEKYKYSIYTTGFILKMYNHTLMRYESKAACKVYTKCRYICLFINE